MRASPRHNRRLFLVAVALGAASSQAAEPSASCPVTRPKHRGYVGETLHLNHGNGGTLATSLTSDGSIVFKLGGPGCVDPDGTLGMKWPWWRGGRGQLVIEGRRLDGVAPPLRASIPAGYGEAGFQATGLLFPTPGCWQVTGKVAEASLSFVTLVVKVDQGPAPPWRRLGIVERGGRPPTE